MSNDYFDALARRDVEAMAALWAPDGEEHIAEPGRRRRPGRRARVLHRAVHGVPGLRADRARRRSPRTTRSPCTGRRPRTMTGPLWGLEPTGAHIELEGIDLLRVRDGLIVRNDAVPDGMALARQIGLVPRGGLGGSSSACSRAFNVAHEGVARQAAAKRRPRARRRRRLAAARRRPAHDERVPARGRGRRRDAVRRRHPPDDARDRHGGGAARRHQPRRARPRRRRPPRRGARPRACRCSATRPTARRRRSGEPQRDYHRARPAAASRRAGSTRGCSSYWDGGPVRDRRHGRRGRRRQRLPRRAPARATRRG